MKYRQLGRTGLSVSEVGVGCEGFVGKSASEVRALVDAMEDLGINFMDFYSPDPALLENFGYAIAGRRDKFVLQQHLCAVWKNGQYLRTRNVEETKRGFEERLRLVGTDHFEIGMIHYVDALSDWEVCRWDILPIARKLKDEGKILHIGLSSHNPEVALEAIKEKDLSVLLFSVNPCYDLQPAGEDVEQLWAESAYSHPLLNMDPERQRLYETCERQGVGIDVMKAFGGGDLLHADVSPAKVSLSPYECMAYALSRPGVASVMAGARSVGELAEDGKYSDAPEDQKDFAGALASMPMIRWEGHCMYCGHCAPCPVGISVADVTRYLNLARAQGSVPETVAQHYSVLAHHGSECIGCGACETRCPFHVPVRENMRLAAKTFGV